MTYLVWYVVAPVFLPAGWALEATFLQEVQDVKVVQALGTDCTLAVVAEDNYASVLTHNAELQEMSDRSQFAICNSPILAMKGLHLLWVGGGVG